MNGWNFSAIFIYYIHPDTALILNLVKLFYLTLVKCWRNFHHIIDLQFFLYPLTKPQSNENSLFGYNDYCSGSLNQINYEEPN